MKMYLLLAAVAITPSLSRPLFLSLFVCRNAFKFLLKASRYAFELGYLSDLLISLSVQRMRINFKICHGRVIRMIHSFDA